MFFEHLLFSSIQISIFSSLSLLPSPTFPHLSSSHVHIGTALDEQVLADGVVTHFGQVIGVVVAESQPLAQRAAQSVQVTYQDLPSIITIQVSRLRREGRSLIGPSL